MYSARRESRLDDSDRFGQFQCPDCSEYFRTRGFLDTHIKRIHRRESRGECAICNLGFESCYFLKKHISDKHEDFLTVPVRCSQCGQNFLNVDKLKSHVNVHLPRSHKCRHCSATFQRKQNLREHEAYHSGNKTRLTCPHCMKTVGTPSILIAHIKSAHAVDEGACKKCPFCAVFWPVEKFNNHLQKHIKGTDKRRANCSFCPKEFSSIVSVDKHCCRVHASSDFTCPFCQSVFKNPKNGVEHLKSHEDADAQSNRDKDSTSENENNAKEKSRSSCVKNPSSTDAILLTFSRKDDSSEAVEFVCDDCKQQVTDSDLLRHASAHSKADEYFAVMDSKGATVVSKWGLRSVLRTQVLSRSSRSDRLFIGRFCGKELFTSKGDNGSDKSSSSCANPNVTAENGSVSEIARNDELTQEAAKKVNDDATPLEERNTIVEPKASSPATSVSGKSLRFEILGKAPLIFQCGLCCKHVWIGNLMRHSLVHFGRQDTLYLIYADQYLTVMSSQDWNVIESIYHGKIVDGIRSGQISDPHAIFHSFLKWYQLSNHQTDFFMKKKDCIDDLLKRLDSTLNFPNSKDGNDDDDGFRINFYKIKAPTEETAQCKEVWCSLCKAPVLAVAISVHLSEHFSLDLISLEENDYGFSAFDDVAQAFDTANAWKELNPIDLTSKWNTLVQKISALFVEVRENGGDLKAFTASRTLICFEKLVGGEKLRNGMVIESTEELGLPYTCHACRKDFVEFSELSDHAVADHGIKKNEIYHCNSCSQVFTSRGFLMKHMQFRHKIKENLGQCPMCDFEFQNYSQMGKHMTEHKQEMVMSPSHLLPSMKDIEEERSKLKNDEAADADVDKEHCSPVSGSDNSSVICQDNAATYIFQCSECDKNFPSFVEASKHMTEAHCDANQITGSEMTLEPVSDMETTLSSVVIPADKSVNSNSDNGKHNKSEISKKSDKVDEHTVKNLSNYDKPSKRRKLQASSETSVGNVNQSEKSFPSESSSKNNRPVTRSVANKLAETPPANEKVGDSQDVNITAVDKPQSTTYFQVSGDQSEIDRLLKYIYVVCRKELQSITVVECSVSKT